MEESKPEEHESHRQASDQESGGPSTGEKNGDQDLSSSTGTGEADAVTGAGSVAGRGPGSTVEFQPRRVGLSRGMAALRHRDFRLFWLGQLVSLIGTWMQVLAQSWLVLEIGGSALDLGTISALQFLPILALSLFGGIVADRFPKRRLLLATQSAAMILAFALAALVWTGTATVGYVMAMAFLLGVVSAVDMPTRLSYVVELVGREDLPNAVALNSAAFNAARLAGPALSGLLIGWVGTATVFLLNGLSFLSVLAALLAVSAGSTAVADGIRPGAIMTNVREGLQYVRRTPPVLSTVLLVALVGTFGMNFGVVVPLLAREVLSVGPDGFGVLMSAMGLGSLVASVMLALLEWAPHPRILVGSAAVFGFLEIVLSDTTEFFPAAMLFGAIGFAMIVFTTVANTGLQTSTPDHLRGRVMSVYITVFVGTTPLGSLFAGSLAQMAGVSMSLLAGGAISIFAALVSWRQAAGRSYRAKL